MLTFDIFEKDSEVFDLYEVIKVMHSESPYNEYSMNPEYIMNMLLSFRTNDQVIFLLRSEEKIAGYLMASAQPHHLFPQIKCAVEHSWYVLPEYRKEASWSLIDAYEQWAKVIGCQWATLANYNTPKLDELYKARGYKHVEQSFLKDLQ